MENWQKLHQIPQTIAYYEIVGACITFVWTLNQKAYR